MLALCACMCESPSHGLQTSGSTTSAVGQKQTESVQQLLTAELLFYTLSLEALAFWLL